MNRPPLMRITLSFQKPIKLTGQRYGIISSISLAYFIPRSIFKIPLDQLPSVPQNNGPGRYAPAFPPCSAAYPLEMSRTDRVFEPTPETIARLCQAQAVIASQKMRVLNGSGC